MSKHTTPTLHRATCDTRHFEWEAYGASETEARKVLREILRANTDFTEDELDTLVEDDTHVYEVRAGLGLRDGDPVNQ